MQPNLSWWSWKLSYFLKMFNFWGKTFFFLHMRVLWSDLCLNWGSCEHPEMHEKGVFRVSTSLYPLVRWVPLRVKPCLWLLTLTMDIVIGRRRLYWAQIDDTRDGVIAQYLESVGISFDIICFWPLISCIVEVLGNSLKAKWKEWGLISWWWVSLLNWCNYAYCVT